MVAWYYLVPWIAYAVAVTFVAAYWERRYRRADADRRYSLSGKTPWLRDAVDDVNKWLDAREP